MPMLEAKFDDACTIQFSPPKKKPFDATRLQAAMFMDRPDLWQKKRSRHQAKLPKGQLRLPGKDYD